MLGHEDRVVAVGGLPAVVARLGRRQALRDDLRGVSPHRLRTAQLSRGPLAPAQVEPPPERSRARAVDPVIDLGGVGHSPRLGTARWADNEAKTGRVSARPRTSSARRRDDEELEQPHVFLGQLEQGRSRTRSARAPITARYRNLGPEPMSGIARRAALWPLRSSGSGSRDSVAEIRYTLSRAMHERCGHADDPAAAAQLLGRFRCLPEY